MNILVTGAAGFIGMHTILRIRANDHSICGIDNCNSSYEPRLQTSRLENLKRRIEMGILELDITNENDLVKAFSERKFDIVIHLAAQVGVRGSMRTPRKYYETNVIGFLNVIDACSRSGVSQFIYASSSSIYGNCSTLPFTESEKLLCPTSTYALTKLSGEQIAEVYSKTRGLHCTGLRFFTVYGPWGRPDMAYFKFTRNIFEGLPIELYNEGNHQRDMTYIDDVTRAINAVIGYRGADHDIFNIGCNNPISLNSLVNSLESIVGKKAVTINRPLQEGDVICTDADINKAMHGIGYVPKVQLGDGLRRFVNWYRKYYGV